MPSGDQPEAIEIVNNFNNGLKEQILLGATGTARPSLWLMLYKNG